MTAVYLHTFGCKANQYDTDVLRQMFERAGVCVVDDPEAADAAVVNSCTVTHVAERKMRGLVRRLARGGTARTVVMGCAAALDDGTIAGLPGVTGVVGAADPAAVFAALDLEVPPADPVLRGVAGRSRAWLRIQDGCDEHCTFCATTLARGANRSRPADEVIAEAGALADGTAEIVLTGVHIGTWGRDLDPPRPLGVLVERLVREVPDVRFRLSSVEATEVDDRLADLMTSEPHRLAPHLHAPLQSGSDPVLKRMGRHWYTATTYADRIERLATRLPVFGLGADIIVGFPGETDEDHRATVDLVRALPFTYAHVFPYSERPGAAAGRLGPAVDPQIAAERSAELRQLAAEKGTAHRTSRIGSAADIVLLDRRDGRWFALTGDYLTAYLPTEVVPTGDRLVATLARANGRLTAHPLIFSSSPNRDQRSRGEQKVHSRSLAG